MQCNVAIENWCTKILCDTQLTRRLEKKQISFQEICKLGSFGHHKATHASEACDGIKMLSARNF